MTFLTEIEKSTLKFIWDSSSSEKKNKVHTEAQKTRNSKGNTRQKEQYWGYHNT
jgi:hypothetical protein